MVATVKNNSGHFKEGAVEVSSSVIILFNQGEVIFCFLINKNSMARIEWPSPMASKTRKQVAKGKVGVFLPLSCQQHTTRSTEVFRAARCSRASFFLSFKSQFAFQFLHLWCSFHMNFILWKSLLLRIGFTCCIKKTPNQQDIAFYLLPCAVCRAERQALSTPINESRK